MIDCHRFIDISLTKILYILRVYSNALMTSEETLSKKKIMRSNYAPE